MLLVVVLVKKTPYCFLINCWEEAMKLCYKSLINLEQLWR